MALIRPIASITSNGLHAYVPVAGDMATFTNTMGTVSNNTLSVSSSFRGGIVANVKNKTTMAMQTIVEMHGIGFKSDGTCGLVSISQSGSTNVSDYDYIVGEIYGGGTVTLT